MTKTFTLYGTDEYTVTTCTAIASCDLDTANRQDALLVSSYKNGEEFKTVVFGYKMPETDKDFAEMCEDSSAWESDYEVLDTVWTDPNTNRQIVQEGLDARAEARAEATQEAQDDLFLAELNKLTQASRDMTARLEAAQRRARAQKREQRREKRQEEAEATRRDTFMQRIFIALCIIAAVIWLHTIEAVAFWLAMTISIAGLLYILAISVGYWFKPRRKADNHG